MTDFITVRPITLEAGDTIAIDQDLAPADESAPARKLAKVVDEPWVVAGAFNVVVPTNAGLLVVYSGGVRKLKMR